jgi:hypothetical protein
MPTSPTARQAGPVFTPVPNYTPRDALSPQVPHTEFVLLVLALSVLAVVIGVVVVHGRRQGAPGDDSSAGIRAAAPWGICPKCLTPMRENHYTCRCGYRTPAKPSAPRHGKTAARPDNLDQPQERK